MTICYCTGKCREGGGCAVQSYQHFTYGHTTVQPKPLSEDDIRRVVREEQDRYRNALQRIRDGADPWVVSSEALKDER
jgi:hypothetical protein